MSLATTWGRELSSPPLLPEQQQPPPPVRDKVFPPTAVPGQTRQKPSSNYLESAFPKPACLCMCYCKRRYLMLYAKTKENKMTKKRTTATERGLFPVWTHSPLQQWKPPNPAQPVPPPLTCSYPSKGLLEALHMVGAWCTLKGFPPPWERGHGWPRGALCPEQNQTERGTCSP